MKHIASSPVSIASLWLISSLFVFGCSGKPATQPQPVTTPTSPRDALIQLTEAIHEGNEAKLLAVLKATETQTELFRLQMQFLVVARDFRDAFIKAYGEQAWKDFQDESKAPKDGDAKLFLPDPQEKIAQIRERAIDERADEAFCQSVDEPGKTVRIIKDKNGWRVDASSIWPKEDELQKVIGQFKPMVEVVRKYKKAIGRPGITGEDIDAELGRESMKLLKGVESPAPHRFDIDKL